MTDQKSNYEAGAAPFGGAHDAVDVQEDDLRVVYVREFQLLVF